MKRVPIYLVLGLALVGGVGLFRRRSLTTLHGSSVARPSAKKRESVSSLPGRRPVRPNPEECGCAKKLQDPNCFPEGMTQIQSLIGVGKFKEAREQLLEFLKAHPTNVESLNQLALLYRDKFNDPDQADRYFRLALENNPDRLDISADLSQLLITTGSVDDGLHFFSGLDVRFPDNPHVKLALGALEIQSRHPDKAVAYLEHALEIMPDLLKAYDLLADAQLKRNEPEKAVETLRRLLRFHLARKREVETQGYSTAGIDFDIQRVSARLGNLGVN